MASLQGWGHRFETMWSGWGWCISLGGLLIVLLAVGYNWRSFHNLRNPEAMEAAQVGRNLASGRGYKTQFIRPFSIYLIKKRNLARFGDSSAAVASDPAQLNRTHTEALHPDLANPPLFPLVLAGLMKGLPFKMVGCELLWRFSLSGLSTQLLLLIVSGKQISKVTDTGFQSARPETAPVEVLGQLAGDLPK